MKKGGSNHKLTAYEVEQANKLLEKLASQFPEGGKEFKAIELAAKALLFSFQTGIAKEFRSFLENFDSELTDEQKKRLRNLGIQS